MPVPIGSRKRKVRPSRADVGDGGFEVNYDSMDSSMEGEGGSGDVHGGQEKRVVDRPRRSRSSLRRYGEDFVEEYETDEDDVISGSSLSLSEGEDDDDEEYVNEKNVRGVDDNDNDDADDGGYEFGTGGVTFAPVFVPVADAAADAERKAEPGKQQEVEEGKEIVQEQQQQYGGDGSDDALKLRKKKKSKDGSLSGGENTAKLTKDDPLAFLAGIAGEAMDADTPRAPPHGIGTGGIGGVLDTTGVATNTTTAPANPINDSDNDNGNNNNNDMPPPKKNLALLSRSLLRGEGGVVTGAKLKLHWEPGTRNPGDVSSRLTRVMDGAADMVELDEFEVMPEECRVELILRLAVPSRHLDTNGTGTDGDNEAVVARPLEVLDSIIRRVIDHV